MVVPMHLAIKQKERLTGNNLFQQDDIRANSFQIARIRQCYLTVMQVHCCTLLAV